VEFGFLTGVFLKMQIQNSLTFLNAITILQTSESKSPKTQSNVTEEFNILLWKLSSTLAETCIPLQPVPTSNTNQTRQTATIQLGQSTNKFIRHNSRLGKHHHFHGLYRERQASRLYHTEYLKPLLQRNTAVRV